MHAWGEVCEFTSELGETSPFRRSLLHILHGLLFFFFVTTHKFTRFLRRLPSPSNSSLDTFKLILFIYSFFKKETLSYEMKKNSSWSLSFVKYSLEQRCCGGVIRSSGSMVSGGYRRASGGESYHKAWHLTEQRANKPPSRQRHALKETYSGLWSCFVSPGAFGGIH